MSKVSNLVRDVEQLKKKCCCKSFGTTNGEPVGTPVNGVTVLFDTSTGIFYYWDGDSWEIFSSGGGGDSLLYYELTRAECDLLVAADGLLPGATYKITDRGDAGIILTADSVSTFFSEGTRIMLVPEEIGYETNSTVTYNSLPYSSRGIWNPWYNLNIGYIFDDLVIFNGHYWINTLPTEISVNSSIPDDLGSWQTNLGSDWVRIEKDDPLASQLYVEKQFRIVYEYANDWIAKQWDDHGNVVGISSRTHSGIVNILPTWTANPVDYTDWSLADYLSGGLDVAKFEMNDCPFGIYNNYPNQLADTTQLTIRGNKIGGIVNNYGSTVIIDSNHGTENQSSLSTFVYSGYLNVIVNNINDNTDLWILSNSGITGGIRNNVGVNGIRENNVGIIYSNIGSGSGCNIYSSIGLSIATNTISGDGIYRNNVTIIENNTFGGTVSGNTGTYLASNVLSGGVLYNTFSEIVANNVTGGGILNNNVVTIVSNTIANGDISSNQCVSIDNCSGGIKWITGNHISGSITAVNSDGLGDWQISNNNNNGNITGMLTADLLGTVVNLP